jgi:putative membrane protein
MIKASMPSSTLEARSMLLYALSVLATALALLVADFILPGLVISGFPTAILAGIVIGVVNAIIRPVLFILSLPITILTLGLFALAVNGLSLWLASLITPGFSVNGFWAFILGPILISMVSTTLNRFLVNQVILGSSDSL